MIWLLIGARRTMHCIPWQDFLTRYSGSLSCPKRFGCGVSGQRKDSSGSCQQIFGIRERARSFSISNCCNVQQLNHSISGFRIDRQYRKGLQKIINQIPGLPLRWAAERIKGRLTCLRYTHSCFLPKALVLAPLDAEASSNLTRTFHMDSWSPLYYIRHDSL